MFQPGPLTSETPRFRVILSLASALGADGGHHVAHIALDLEHEGGEVALAALDARQLRFPLAGHRGALHVRVDHGDERDALVRRGQHLVLADDVLAAEERLEDRGACRRRAEAALAHRLGDLLLFERAACRLHGGEQRAVGEAGRRSRASWDRLGVGHAPWLTHHESTRQCLLGHRAARALARARRYIEYLPARNLHAGARAGVAIPRLVPRDHRGHVGHGDDVVSVPCREQAPAHEIVDALLFGGEIAGRPLLGWDDGVVIGDA